MMTRAKKTSRARPETAFVTLKDGRQIAVAPSGGDFSKAEIRAAVRRAVHQRRNAAMA